MHKKVANALISVYNKTGLEKIVRMLDSMGVNIYSTGGTYDFMVRMGIPAHTVESLTGYPSILGGRVKTLHPKVFGGILGRQDVPGDMHQLKEYNIPQIDLVVADLYPFEETLASGASRQEIIEKIDIGGISLIRAAAKNYKDVLVIPSTAYYAELIRLLTENKGSVSLETRERFACLAFAVSSAYDTAIFNYFNRRQKFPVFARHISGQRSLRYGENPHQQSRYYGDLEALFTQLHGKELSHNNLVDIDAAIHLIREFNNAPAFAILKHTNACGIAVRDSLPLAWKDALAGDPVSAFGGVLIANRPIDAETAAGINTIFFEVILAPGYEPGALALLKSKKNRIILENRSGHIPDDQFKSILNGVLEQDKDNIPLTLEEMKVVTVKSPTDQEKADLLFANKVVKHTKSNAIVLAKNNQLIASGTGQTSRVDALRQAIQKAKTFSFDTTGAVMASDAFFPFSDSVQIAGEAGISAVIQPGGSVRDQDSVDYCDKHNMSMVFTGKRHFKH